ncbi:MAG: hypothetical protein Kow00120_18420 [Anaerolineae bacterium]
MSAELCVTAADLASGLRLAMAVGAKPVLCVASPARLRLAMVHDGCTVFSWERPAPGVAGVEPFVVPAHIARILLSGALEGVETLCFAVQGQDVRLKLGGEMPAELSWQWTPEALGAPAEFEQMVAHPLETVAVPVERLLAAVDNAAAQAQPADTASDIRHSLAAVQPVAATLAIAGQRLAHDTDPTAYFDPTCLVQAARLVAGEARAGLVYVGLAALEGPAAFLSLVAERDGWRVQGTIKSVLVEAAQTRAAQTRAAQTQAAQTQGAETPPAEGAASDLGAFAAPEPDVIEVADGGVLVETATSDQTPALMPTPAAVAFEDFDDAGAPDFMADVGHGVGHDVARDTPAGAGDMNVGDQEAGQEAEKEAELGEEAAAHDAANSVLRRRDTGSHLAHFDVPLD